MSDLHEILLATVERAACKECPGWLTDAVRAVLELHHPRRCAGREGGPHVICSGCPGHEMHARCHTVRAVARELGVEA